MMFSCDVQLCIQSTRKFRSKSTNELDVISGRAVEIYSQLVDSTLKNNPLWLVAHLNHFPTTCLFSYFSYLISAHQGSNRL
jgi:hypothetical protein